MPRGEADAVDNDQVEEEDDQHAAEEVGRRIARTGPAVSGRAKLAATRLRDSSRVSAPTTGGATRMIAAPIGPRCRSSAASRYRIGRHDRPPMPMRRRTRRARAVAARPLAGSGRPARRPSRPAARHERVLQASTGVSQRPVSPSLSPRPTSRLPRDAQRLPADLQRAAPAEPVDRQRHAAIATTAPPSAMSRVNPAPLSHAPTVDLSTVAAWERGWG